MERSGRPPGELAAKLPAIPHWLAGDKQPTLHQLESFAKATYTPLGYLFLSEPIREQLPIPYYRTLRDERAHRPSANLIAMVQAMQRRQAWMKEFLIDEGMRPLSFVGSAKTGRNPIHVAHSIRETLGLADGWAAKFPNWADALRGLRLAAESAGILVAANGIVGYNTHRKLDLTEFRGFVLVDNYAPLIFINAADYKGAQMFTLAHELAHVWVGSSAAFDLRELRPAADAVEQVCNRAAAEFLAPEAELRAQWADARGEPNLERIRRATKYFKVSEMVVARRALDLGLISKNEFLEFYRIYSAREKKKPSSEGGDFHAMASSRIGERFARAVKEAVMEGKLLYREAYNLTDLHGETFERFFAEFV
jgi:Zn-dependent peptidase ImmA (M78 family)